VRQNPKARQAKSKARLNRFEELSNVDYQSATSRKIFIPAASGSATKSSNSKASPRPTATALLIDNFSFKVPAGAIVRHHRPERSRQINHGSA